jgi:hypothetical protein
MFAWQANNSPDRLTTPLIRRNGQFVPTDWDSAMDRIVGQSKELPDTRGPGALSFYTTGQLFLLEEYYTLGVIARGAIGTNHVDGNTRLCTSTAAEALKESFGCDGQPGSYRDVDHADVVALYGHNVAETQAVLWIRILDRLAGPHPRSSCASTRAEPPSPSWPISTWWPPVTVTEFHDRGRAEGYRLRLLVIDEVSAEVVRRIFAEYMDGLGDRAIANGLNREGIPCPSARRPDQNRHRLADGWQGSAVRAILDNPRYTGYAVFGRWTKHEVLLNPDDVAAGHVVRFRRSSPDRIVRSRKPAHPAIVSVEDFVEVQLLRRSRAAGGLEARRKLERGPKAATKRPYPLRGRVRCALCERRMEGTPRKERTYYRCPARTLVPGSPLLATHPKNVYLPEASVLTAVNDWLGDEFARENRDRTVAALVASQDAGAQFGTREAAKKRLDSAEARLRRLRAAIEAGVDPTALVESINTAQSERTAARAELDNAPMRSGLDVAEVYAMIDSYGDVHRILLRAEPAELEDLYGALGLEMVYDHDERAVDVIIRPTRRDSVCVRGRSCTLTTRFTF